MRIIILLNPSARRGKARQMLAGVLQVLRRQNMEFEVRESRSAAHLLELARVASAERPDIIVSAGGDGTHHYVINGVFESQIPLGLLPMGTGNDLAKGVGLPSDVHAAASALVNGTVRQIDIARAGSAVYACIAGVGFDSIVTSYANQHARWFTGPLAYTWSLLCCMSRYRPYQLEITADGKSITTGVIFAVVGNNSSYGGGIHLTPRARLDDGLLDVCVVPFMSRLELLRWVPRAYRGEHLKHPRIQYLQARKVTLRSNVPMELFGDGEFLQELPATIEVLPRALRVVAPG